ncbi:MAG: hypothetical protein ACLR06_09465 [Christensenellaceae bacterium]
MPLHAKADFVCTLIDKNDKELLKFKAAAASDLILSANYEGGGIASGGQALTVSTEREFNYQAFAHRVIALGRTFAVNSVQVSFPQAFGRGRAHEKNIYSGAAMT